MKRFTPFLILLFTGIACTAPTNDAAEGLSQTLKVFNEAFAAADTATLASMITEEYSHVNGTSRPYSRREWLGYVAGQRQKLNDGQLTIETYEMDNISITFYEGSAVVTGQVSTSGVEGGIRFEKRFRVTHLWVLEGGRWKRAGFHDGRIE